MDAGRLGNFSQIHASPFGERLVGMRKMEPYMVRKRTGALAAMRFWEEGRMGTLPGPNV